METSDTAFDPWNRIFGDDCAAFIQRYDDVFETHMTRKKTESYRRFRVANQRMRSNASEIGRNSPAIKLLA